MYRSAGFGGGCVQLVLLWCACAAAVAEPIPVELERADDSWQLLRGGEPYLVKGAGGTGPLAELAALGANSVRTWDGDGIGPLLDQAHALGLSVAVGIWLGHERHGFDYDDPEQVAEQQQRARRIIERYKDHPAVLLWGIGNEMEGFAQGDNPKIWRAVNDIAAMAKEIDPHHPTMTVTADIGGGRIAAVNSSSAIDIHGINSYGGAASLRQRYLAGGGRKPYILTEFGPAGAWEVSKTDWDAPLEPSSTEKSRAYRYAYDQAIRAAEGLALGSYAFNWGYKMEATATWFGLLLPDGAQLGATDVLQALWTGQQAANLAPEIESLKLVGSAVARPKQKVVVRALAEDPEDGKLTARWVLRPEAHEHFTGGDFRPIPPGIDEAIIAADSNSATLRMPAQPGPYRHNYYVYDDNGKAATANLPLRVKGKGGAPLPFYVYHDTIRGMPWVPSGWMGQVDHMELDGEYPGGIDGGTAALRLRLTASTGWGGIAWQHPANNWGDLDGGFDLRGARVLELWARGEYGGERISIGVGLIGKDKPYPDSAQRKIENIVLTGDWQRYRIPLRGLDLGKLRTGFVITLSARPTPVTVYLDNIRYVR